MMLHEFYNVSQSPPILQEGKEPDPSKRPYVVQYSMKPKSAKKYLNVVKNYSNIILGETYVHMYMYLNQPIPFSQFVTQ